MAHDHTSVPVFSDAELDALAEQLDREKPWDIAPYKSMRFMRTWLCTFLTIVLTIFIIPSIWVAVIISAAAFAYDFFISRKAYDQTLPTSELVRIMYRTGEEQPWIEKGEFKKYLLTGLAVFLFQLALVAAAKVELVPLFPVKLILVASFIGAAAYSSYFCVLRRISKGLFTKPDEYAQHEAYYGKVPIPYTSMFYFFLPERIRRAIDTIITSLLAVIITLTFAVIIVKNLEFIKEAPWWICFSTIGLSSITLLMLIWIYPTRPFMFKCILIENFRQNSMKGEVMEKALPIGAYHIPLINRNLVSH